MLFLLFELRVERLLGLFGFDSCRFFSSCFSAFSDSTTSTILSSVVGSAVVSVLAVFFCFVLFVALGSFALFTSSVFSLFAGLSSVAAIGLFGDDVYMSLRDIICYFGYVMQSFFGFNTWVKSLDVNRKSIEAFYESSSVIYKIFVDVKYPSEVSYIRKNSGKVIKVNRLNHIKEDSDISSELDFDDRIDYELSIENLKDIKEDIKVLTESIL